MSTNMSSHARGLSDPARGAFPVTPSDSTIFDNIGSNPPPARSVYVGGAGNLAVEFVDGSQATFANVGAGTLLPFHVSKVLSTGTTATNIVGVF